jgi:ABC-type transport system substrate-binding protein
MVGQRVVTTKCEDFVPVPENPEYAAPVLNEIEWQWRSETTVRTAMIEAGEADWAFLLTLEDADQLGPERFVTGGIAEIAQFLIDTVFDPWLSNLKMRQAIVHSINCPAIVASLYQGPPPTGATVALPAYWALLQRTWNPTSMTRSSLANCWKKLAISAVGPTQPPIVKLK